MMGVRVLLSMGTALNLCGYQVCILRGSRYVGKFYVDTGTALGGVVLNCTGAGTAGCGYRYGITHALRYALKYLYGIAIPTHYGTYAVPQYAHIAGRITVPHSTPPLVRITAPHHAGNSVNFTGLRVQGGSTVRYSTALRDAAPPGKDAQRRRCQGPGLARP